MSASQPSAPSAGSQSNEEAAESSSIQHCTVCGQHFTRIDHLRRHELSHSFPQHQCPHPSCGMLFHRRDVMKRHMAVHEPSPTKKRRRARRGVVPVISQSRLGQRPMLSSDGSDNAQSSTQPAVTVQASSSTSAYAYQPPTQMLSGGSNVLVSTTSDTWTFNPPLAAAPTYSYDSYGVGSPPVDSGQGGLGTIYGTMDTTGMPSVAGWPARTVVTTSSGPIPGTASYTHHLGPYADHYPSSNPGGYS